MRMWQFSVLMNAVTYLQANASNNEITSIVFGFLSFAWAISFFYFAIKER